MNLLLYTSSCKTLDISLPRKKLYQRTFYGISTEDALMQLSFWILIQLAVFDLCHLPELPKNQRNQEFSVRE